MCRALCPLANVNKQIVQKWDLYLCVASNSLVTKNNRRNWYLLNYKFPDDSKVDKFQAEKLFGFFSILEMEKIKVEQENGSNL